MWLLLDGSTSEVRLVVYAIYVKEKEGSSGQALLSV